MVKLLVFAAAATLAVTPLVATSEPSTPASVVKSAYSCIFSNACPESKARGYLTPAFAKEFAEVDALEQRCRCAVIDASPWIDAQAGPKTFAVGAARIAGKQASVPIHFSGGKAGSYSLTIETEHMASGWAISDILMHNGASTAAMMAANLRSTQAVATTPDAVLTHVEKWYNDAAMSNSIARSFDSIAGDLTPSFARQSRAKLSQGSDPFTLGTARVTDWETSKANVDGDTANAIIRLQFKGGARSQLVYRLQRIGGHWAIANIVLR